MSDSLLPVSGDPGGVVSESIHSEHYVDNKPEEYYSPSFGKRRELNGEHRSRFSCDWNTVKRTLLKKKWYGSSILLIIILAVGPAIGIGLDTLGVGGTHEPLHVVSVDGNSPREGVCVIELEVH